MTPVKRVDPTTFDRAATRHEMCLHDFAAFGACVRLAGHSGAHRDTNGYGWAEQVSQTFFGDEGAVYSVETTGEQVIVTGNASRVTYGRHDVETATRLEVTGIARHQRVGLDRPYRVLGRRGILHLDTGEGISTLRGVIVERSA